MNRNARHSHADRFWQAWDMQDATALPPEDRALFALAQQLAEGTPPPHRHREQLRAILLARWHLVQRRRWLMQQLHIARQRLTVAIALTLLAGLLVWGITRLRPQPSPATAVHPVATSSAAPRLAPNVCPSTVPPRRADAPPADEAILGGGSVQVGDFGFTLLAYCDPTLQAGADSALGGLGVWVQWDYAGVPLEGTLYEWWGPESGQQEVTTWEATPETLPLTVHRGGGWPLAAAAELGPSPLTLTYEERLDTPRGTFGAQLHLTLRRGTSGWQVDNVTVEPLRAATPTPTPTMEATPATAWQTYTVQTGDTCESIAWQFRVPVNDLLQANDLPPSCPLGVGMSLRVPLSPWEDAAPERLTPDATPAQIRAKVLAPSWQRVWVMGMRTTWTNGESRTMVGQAYLTAQGEGWLALWGPLTANTEALRLPGAPNLRLVSRESTDGHHPLPGTDPFLDPAFPLFLADPGVQPVPRFLTVFARRMALVVDWGAYRLWVDTDTGLILRSEHYRRGSPPDGDLDAVTQWLAVVYDPHEPPPPPTNRFPDPPAPEAPDLATAWLRFEATLVGENPGPEGIFAARLYADETSLGALNLGTPAMLGCDRSPDGTRLAWMYHDATQGTLLAWAPLAQPVQAQLGFDLPRLSSPPTWAPDGHRVAYVGCQAEQCGLFVVDTATGQARWLHALADDAAPPLWSPDGSALAALHKTDAGLEVVIARVADGEITYRGPFDADTWSAASDSPLAAWDARFLREIGSFTRCIAPPAAGQSLSIPADLASRPLRFEVHASAGPRDNSALAEVQTVDGQRLGVLDLGGLPDTLCRRAPDGLHLAYARFPNAANAQTALIRLVDLRDLLHPHDLAYAHLPALAFSPDGKALAVLGSRSAEASFASLLLFDVADGALRRQTSLFPDGAFPAAVVWRPDGGALAVLGTVFKTPHVWAFDRQGNLLLDETLTDRYQPQAGSPLADWGVVFPANPINSSGWGLQACETP